MAAQEPAFSNTGFAKTFVVPALFILLVPVAALAFFLHAESRFNAEARESILKQIRQDPTLTPERRKEAIQFFSFVRFSDLMKNAEFAQRFDGMVRFNFATFRWMIRLSVLSTLTSVAVFALAGLCVLLSLRSQRSQYLSLSIGWHVLRIYGALQTLVQGILLVALSYWVTALWMNRYSPKLILAVGALAVIGVIAVVAAIFKRIDVGNDVEGMLLSADGAGRFFDELHAICRESARRLPIRSSSGSTTISS